MPLAGLDDDVVAAGAGVEVDDARKGERGTSRGAVCCLHLLRRVARHYDDPDDSVVLERQAQLEIALVRHFAGLTPASDLVCASNDFAVNFLELGLRLFHLELLVSARLLKYLPAGLDATKRATRRHRFHIGIE